MIIDFHTHIYPDAIAQKATDSICEFYGLSTDLSGTAESLLREGRSAGIDKFVLLPVAVRPSLVHSVNDFTSHAVADHSEFIGFGTLHAEMSDPLAELERFSVLGLKGLKFHPDTQGFDADDPRLFPVYDAISGKYPVLIHCGDITLKNSSPDKIKRIIREFPKLTVIAAHLGGWSCFSEAVETLSGERCFVDMSSCCPPLDEKTLVSYIRRYGAERVLFGTDFPLWDPKTQVEIFSRLPLTDDEKDLIAYKNAVNILSV